MAVSFFPCQERRGADIRRFSRAAECTLGAALILILCGIAVYALGFPSSVARHHPWAVAVEPSSAPVGVGWSIAVFAVLFLTALPVFYALNAARRMFRGFAKQGAFTGEAADELQRLALGLFAAALMEPFGAIGLTAVLSAAGAAHGVAVTFSIDQLWLALFGLVILGLAKVMREAAVMADEHARII